MRCQVLINATIPERDVPGLSGFGSIEIAAGRRGTLTEPNS